MNYLLEGIAFAFCLAMLLIALKQDLKERAVNDFVWIAFGLIGLIILAARFLIEQTKVELLLVPMTITVIFIAVIYLLGKLNQMLFIGPADLKAIIVISFYFQGMLALNVFILALLISLAMPAQILINNLIKKEKVPCKGLKGIALYITGYKKKITSLEKFESPLEKITFLKKEHRTFFLSPLIEPEKENKRLKELAKKRKIKNIVWVTPLPAFMIFLLISFVIIYGAFLAKVI